MAQVFERGSGASRAATILSASGFDIGSRPGRGAAAAKDVKLIADVGRRHQVSPPGSVVGLAEQGPAPPGETTKGDRNERRHVHAAHQRNGTRRSGAALRESG